MKTVLLAFLLLIVVGFNMDDDDCGCTIISLSADKSIEDSAGEDLLNPSSPNSYKKRDIKTYHLINGEEKRAGIDDNIYQDADSIYRYRTFVNYEGNDESPITYIDWSETDRNTIKSEFYRTDNQTRAIKIW